MASRTYTSTVRERHAEDTRRTILDAAAKLFAEQGYAHTSVAQVAAAAGVALNTVYASVGGKSALVLALAEQGADDSTAIETVNRITALDDPAEILRLTAHGTGQVRRKRQRTLALLFENRYADTDIAAAADLAIRSTRSRLDTVAARLFDTGKLRPELTLEQVEQTLWFYFGFEAWRSARELRWDWDDAAEWLATQASRALLPDKAW